MGLSMARKLIDSGCSVKLYDKYPSGALQQLVDLGAQVCHTAKEAVTDTELVVTALPSAVEVCETMRGADGGFAGMAAGTVWADTTTSDRHVTKQLSKECCAVGSAMLEAPVSNLSHMGIDHGNAVMYVSGCEQQYKQAQAILDHLVERSFYTGELGQAQSAKLLTNLSFHAAAVAAGEALVACVNAGIPVQHAWEELCSLQGTSMALEQFSQFALDGSYDNSCALSVAVKDLGLTARLDSELRQVLTLSLTLILMAGL